MGATFLRSEGERTGRASAAHGMARDASVGLAALAQQSPAAQRVAAYSSLLNASPSAALLQQKQDVANGRAIQRVGDEEEKLQRMPEEDEKLGAMQQKAQGGSSTIQREEAPAPRNDTGLSDQLKTGVESLSGVSMDDVKVHYNSDKPAVVQALAYTQGSEIHVAPGQEQHVPHEAWHVAQQKQGRVAATTQMKGVALNDDPGLEHEADVMGARAAEGG
jgi:hypothetical protein